MEDKSTEIQKSLQNIQQFWDNRAKNTDDDYAKVDTSMRTQRMRFEAFVTSHDLHNKSILDVGCGVGDLWQHLQRHNIDCDYLGTDLSSEMIKRCRERFPETSFEAQNIVEWETEKTFDYVVAIAIHNIKIANGWEILKQVTTRQFELCTTAAHLSLLTDRFEGYDDHIQPWRVERVMEFALTLTPYVLIQHHYLPHDFSITLYREPIIDTRTDLLLSDEASL